MTFGRRVRVESGATTLRPVSRSRYASLVRTAVAGLVLGFGGVTAGTSLVQATERGGLFEAFAQFFGLPVAPRPVAAPQPEPRRASRFASLPDARRVSAVRAARPFTPRPHAELQRRPPRPRDRMIAAGPAPVIGPQTVCVRTCDGYLFPLGNLRAQADVPVHQAACAAACPGAPTALYTLTGGQDLDRAVSLTGQPYLAAAWANVYQRKRVQNCHCQEPGLSAMPIPIASDPTVRIGDTVATGASADVVTGLSRGGVRVEDYRTARSLSAGARRGIDQRVGALQREAGQRAFLRTMRAANADPLRVAEVRYARLRTAGAERDGGSIPVSTAGSAEAGFAPVRVLVPSPFKP